MARPIVSLPQPIAFRQALGATEPTIVHFRFAAMDTPETLIHIAVLVIGVLGILASLAAIAFWWVSRKIKRLT